MDNIYFTKDKPYTVMSEETWDYYKDPPIRNKLFETNNYFEAVMYAIKYYNGCDKEDLEYPWTTSLWIKPEPKGMHFDYSEYIEHLLSTKYK